MGACPCPRCLTPKSKAAYLGTVRDDRRRQDDRRRDDDARNNLVMKARTSLYKGGYVPNSVHVEGILRATSDIPTVVNNVSLFV